MVGPTRTARAYPTMASHLRPVVTTWRGTRLMLLLPGGRSDGNRDAPQAFDLAQHVDQPLLPLRAGLREGNSHLAKPDIEDRSELRFQPALIAVPSTRQAHHQPVAVGLDGGHASGARHQLDPHRVKKDADRRGRLAKAVRQIALRRLQALLILDRRQVAIDLPPDLL